MVQRVLLRPPDRSIKRSTNFGPATRGGRSPGGRGGQRSGRVGTGHRRPRHDKCWPRLTFCNGRSAAHRRSAFPIGRLDVRLMTVSVLTESGSGFCAPPRELFIVLQPYEADYFFF